MISKIFSLRNYVMKQIMKTTDEGIIQIPDPGKIDFGEMIIKENLFKKGINPKTITSDKQLDNILNTPHVAPKVKPKQSGEVIDVDFGKNWPEKKAGGGRTGSGLNYLLGEDDQNSRVPYGDGSSWEQFQKEKLRQTWQEYQQYLKNKEKEERQRPYLEERLGAGPGPVLEAAEGGRARFGAGGMGRRAFLKLMAALGATGVAAKSGLATLLKGGAKKSLTSVPIKAGADGMPAWFKPLVNKVLKEGDDVTKKFADADRQIVHTTKLPNSQTDVIVTQDLTSGNVSVDIGMGKHGFADGLHGQPVRLEYKASEVIEPTIKKGKSTKGTKTKEEFWVEEAEFTGGHPENVKFEETISEKFGAHGSNFDEVEKFATGIVKTTDQLASGGRVPLGGGKLVLEGLMKLANKISPGSTKIGQTSKIMAPKTELKQAIAGFQKRNIPKIWEDKTKVRAAVDDIFPTGDYKYDAEMAAEALVENNPKAFGGKLYDDIDDATRLDVYGSVLRVITNDMAKLREMRKLSKPTKTLEGIHKTGKINISDDAVADEFSRFMKETDPKGFKDIEQKVELSNLDIKGKKGHAEGGRAEFIFGGSAGLKATIASIKAAINKGKTKKIKTLFPKYSVKEKELLKLGEKYLPRDAATLAAREIEGKAGGIQVLIDSLIQDKKILKKMAENKAMNDPGLDFMMKHLEETMYPPHLKKYKNIDKDILQLETIKKNLTMKDRKLNATGGRVSLSAGGLAGMLGE